MSQSSVTAIRARLLLAVAAPAEARAVLRAFGLAEVACEPWGLVALGPSADLVLTGIGKANAAGAVARVLDGRRHRGVISLGLAGALPGSGLGPGAVVVASACIYADEGMESPEGFSTCADLGFPLGDFPGNAVPVDPSLSAPFHPLADRVAPIATVSTCSGTDALAARVAQRTSGAAEAMEGAAVVQVAHRLGMAGAEVRAISNSTGDRARQRWDVAAGLAALTRVLGRALAEG